MQNGKITQLLQKKVAETTVWRTVRQSLNVALDLVLPPRCVVTGEIVDRQGMIDPAVWGQINFIAAPYCDLCGKPFDFQPGGRHAAANDDPDSTLCVSCLYKRPVYDRARAALLYDDASRDIILRFKHGDQLHIVPTLAAWLHRAGDGCLDVADIIVPVPLHPRRLLKRRYNQAALLAQALSRRSSLPTVPDMLVRTRATPPQGHMSFRERKKNVKAAFRMAPRYEDSVRGKTAVLVDDVYTSGATVSECARVLKLKGVAKVYVLAVARVAGTDYFK